MRRGDLWLVEVGRKKRPVLVMTRSEDRRPRAGHGGRGHHAIRGLASEVEFDHGQAGLERHSVINCDGIHTVPRRALTTRVGRVGDDVMREVCRAVSYAIGC